MALQCEVQLLLAKLVEQAGTEVRGKAGHRALLPQPQGQLAWSEPLLVPDPGISTVTAHRGSKYILKAQRQKCAISVAVKTSTVTIYATDFTLLHAQNS